MKYSVYFVCFGCFLSLFPGTVNSAPPCSPPCSMVSTEWTEWAPCRPSGTQTREHKICCPQNLIVRTLEECTKVCKIDINTVRQTQNCTYVPPTTPVRKYINQSWSKLKEQLLYLMFYILQNFYMLVYTKQIINWNINFHFTIKHSVDIQVRYVSICDKNSVVVYAWHGRGSIVILFSYRECVSNGCANGNNSTYPQLETAWETKKNYQKYFRKRIHNDFIFNRQWWKIILAFRS